MVTNPSVLDELKIVIVEPLLSGATAQLLTQSTTVEQNILKLTRTLSETVSKGLVEVRYIPTDFQSTDILTKLLATEWFQCLLEGA